MTCQIVNDSSLISTSLQGGVPANRNMFVSVFPISCQRAALPGNRKNAGCAVRDSITFLKEGANETGAENPNGIPTQSPGLRETSYPGMPNPRCTSTPTGLCQLRSHTLPARKHISTRLDSNRSGHNPVGVVFIWASVTQGSSSLATLGWRPQSRWDWGLASLLVSNYTSFQEGATEIHGLIPLPVFPMRLAGTLAPPALFSRSHFSDSKIHA
jgi:hypothetical protein